MQRTKQRKILKSALLYYTILGVTWNQCDREAMISGKTTVTVMSIKRVVVCGHEC